MDVLLTIILPAVLFLVLEYFWCRPAWLRPPSEPRWAGPQQAPEVTDWDPFALPFVQHRLDVIAAELAWLDDDPEIFAKAFRTHVAKAAYKALLADAVRLGNASRLSAVSALSDTTIVEVEMSNAIAPAGEELEV